MACWGRLLVVAITSSAIVSPEVMAARAECDCSDVQVDGRWSGTGVDTDGTNWSWTLTLKQRVCQLSGSFRWRSADNHSGTERVRGTVDCDRRLRVRGYQLKNVDGTLTTSRYRAAFSRDLRSVKGRWLDGIPGTFKGRKHDPKTPDAECDCGNIRVAGSWFGTGVDTDGTDWKWTLSLKQQGCQLSGAFRWRSVGSRGTELVRGTVDCDRRLRVRGYQLKDVEKGALVTTRYRGVFSPDCRSVKGRWLDGEPGTFKGRKRRGVRKRRGRK